jgi:predicted Zn-dependent protease
LAASWSVIDIVRADGFVAHDVRPLVRLNVQIVAQDGDRRETGYHGLGGRYLYGQLFEEAEWNRAIDIALAQALTNLESVAAPAGEMPVVLAPGWPGVSASRGGRPRASRVTSTARVHRLSPAASASGSPRRVSPWSTTERSETAADR